MHASRGVPMMTMRRSLEQDQNSCKFFSDVIAFGRFGVCLYAYGGKDLAEIPLFKAGRAEWGRTWLLALRKREVVYIFRSL